jgi:hypothetical protein
MSTEVQRADSGVRRLVIAIAGAAWLLALILSISSAITGWSELSNVERDRVIGMTISWLAMPVVGLLFLRGYASLSGSAGSGAARRDANRALISDSKPDSDGS